MRSGIAYLLFSGLALLVPLHQARAPVSVRYTEGLAHGFLVLRTLQGKTLAHGELTQVARGNVVTSHVAFHFRDGSLNDEVTVYSQRRRFRLMRDHLVQKGPSFPHPEDISIDASAGRVAVRYTDENGKEKVLAERMKLPADLANGLIFTLLKNLPRDRSETKASMIVTTPKPRLVTLVFSPRPEDALSIGGEKRQVAHFVVEIELGGVKGLVAPLVGKEPPPVHVWVLDGEAPAFIRSEGPLYPGGPVWQIDLESPLSADDATER